MISTVRARFPLLAVGMLSFVCGYAASFDAAVPSGVLAGAGAIVAAGAVVLDRVRRQSCLSQDEVGVLNVVGHSEFLSRLNGRIQEISSGKGESGVGLVVMDVVASPLGRVSGMHGVLDSSEALVIVEKRLHRNLPCGAFATCVGEGEFMVCFPKISGIPSRLALESVSRASATDLLLLLGDPVELPGRGSCLPVVVRAGVDIYYRGDEVVEGAQKMIQASVACGCGSTLARKHMSVALFSPAMAQIRSRAHAIESCLQDVVRSRGLLVYYQPIVDTLHQRISKVEALLRWPLDRGVIYSPSEFMPIAERAGMISEIGRFVLVEALRQRGKWQISDALQVDLHDLIVSVNVAASSVIEEGFFEFVMQALQDACVNPKYLELELTESEGLIADGEGDGVLRRLQDVGIRVAIDDFGTGYSALSYLPKLNPNTVKIDRSFIHGVLASSRERKLLGAICALCREMDVEIVAEGVETIEQAMLLEEFGVARMQGFVFARPRPPADALQIDWSGWQRKAEI